MEEVNQTNKMKILEELQKNARASLSELAEKTGLTRQTIAKTISKMEKNKEIWGYTTIYDPKIVGKKPYIYLIKFDFDGKAEEFIKIVTSPQQIKDNKEKYLFNSSMFLHGTSDMLLIIWAKDIIEASKNMNNIKRLFSKYVKDIEIFEVLSVFRNNNVTNPNMVEEWKKLLQ